MKPFMTILFFWVISFIGVQSSYGEGIIQNCTRAEGVPICFESPVKPCMNPACGTCKYCGEILYDRKPYGKVYPRQCATYACKNPGDEPTSCEKECVDWHPARCVMQVENCADRVETRPREIEERGCPPKCKPCPETITAYDGTVLKLCNRDRCSTSACDWTAD
jgi:hypothetical protein